MADEKPYIARIHDVHLNNEYSEWLNELISRYRRAQVKAAIKVNSEKLLWNWQMGRDLVMRKAEEKWGLGIVEQVSLDLQAAFPSERGFGSRNIWYMKQWYLFYTQQQDFPKLHQAGAELQIAPDQTVTKLHQVGAEIHEAFDVPYPFPPIFAYIPWRHHTEIISKCKTIEEAAYYIKMDIQNDWSREYLQIRLRERDYHNLRPATNNFDVQLPAPQSTLAKEVIKDSLDLCFVGLPKKYDETQLKDALCNQMTRFLLELGTGFAFVGREKELVVAGKSRRIDLLFYHINLRSYIVAEVKAVPFEPEHASKLNFYVNAVNELIKTENDNPTIGLLICSDMNETEVKWSFGGMTTPLGVASYHNVREIDELLPSAERLCQEVCLLKAEIARLKAEKEHKTD